MKIVKICGIKEVKEKEKKIVLNLINKFNSVFTEDSLIHEACSQIEEAKNIISDFCTFKSEMYALYCKEIEKKYPHIKFDNLY